MNGPKAQAAWPPDHLHTYQDLAPRFQVCARTIARAFKHRPKFKAGKVVRIAEAEVQRYILDNMSGQLVQKADADRRTTRPIESRQNGLNSRPNNGKFPL